MSEKEQQILEIFALVIPKLSENDKSYLLGLGEGICIKTGCQISEKQLDVQINSNTL